MAQGEKFDEIMILHETAKPRNLHAPSAGELEVQFPKRNFHKQQQEIKIGLISKVGNIKKYPGFPSKFCNRIIFIFNLMC